MRPKLFCLLMTWCCGTAYSQSVPTIGFEDAGLSFKWNVNTDAATLTSSGHQTIWTGSLLPGFWVEYQGHKQFLKAVADNAINDSIIKIRIPAGHKNSVDLATGTLTFRQAEHRLDITGITIAWLGDKPKIIEMLIGCRSTSADSINVPTLWDRPFVPDWSAAAYCVPGAKEGPAQSYFRAWDFGQTTINLGNYGPSLGTPYGAAFPRPTLFAAMGGAGGWINFGAGSIPDAAMNLKVLSTKGCIQYLYREDLWGAGDKVRSWVNPIRITADTTAYGSIKKYFVSFAPRKRNKQPSPRSLFNTWGMWRRAIFNLDSIIGFAANINTDIVVMDDQWETAQGSGMVNTTRFPRFTEQLADIRRQKMDIGIWETVGWIADTLPAGLTHDDLICDTAGRPIRTNWNFDSQGPSYYCLDLSSPRSKKYLYDRTRRQMQMLKPVLLKLDFGYAMPSENMGVPRDKELRGERYAYELMKTIADAAKEVNPDVVIMNYGISPLWFAVTDLVSMDDQGDLWYEMRKGHGEWSIWASLLSESGVMVSGSSSYNWDDDKEVLLNTAVLGIPGASLPIDEASPEQVNRRLAMNTWFRRSGNWQPAWFDSETGSYTSPAALHCWGRMENGKLTSLAIRENNIARDQPLRPKGIHSTGRWALISQSSKDIMACDSLAMIPFDEGVITLMSAKPKTIQMLNTGGWHNFTNYTWRNGQLQIKINAAALSQTAGLLVIR